MCCEKKIIVRLISSIRYKRRERAKEGGRNVVDGMVRARGLYKELLIRAHPYRHPNNRILAEEMTAGLTRNKYNYAELLRIEDIDKSLVDNSFYIETTNNE